MRVRGDIRFVNRDLSSDEFRGLSRTSTRPETRPELQFRVRIGQKTGKEDVRDDGRDLVVGGNLDRLDPVAV